MSFPRKPAVVLLSGGLDSTTVLAIAQREGYAVHGLSFRYGQRHQHELEAAARIATAANVESHVILDIDLRAFGGSALTADIDVPKDRPDDGDDPDHLRPRPKHDLPVVRARLAEVLGADDIFVGVNALDYSGYPDCRPEYIEAFEAMANLATKAGVEGARLRIQTPLMQMTKAQIIRRGLELGVDYAQTHSCYDPDGDGLACGHCDSCVLRRRGFAAAGVADPTAYAPGALEPA